MSDKGRNQPKADLRPVYEPPRALRLGDARTGSGGVLECTLPGSGDAFGVCTSNGADAGECLDDGSSAYPTGCYTGPDGSY
ncbi:hypothetical protein ACFLT5_00485 [Chloroflexota bacterium]